MSRATNCHCCNTVWFLASFWNIMTSVDFSTEFLCKGFHQNCSLFLPVDSSLAPESHVAHATCPWAAALLGGGLWSPQHRAWVPVGGFIAECSTLCMALMPQRCSFTVSEMKLFYWQWPQADSARLYPVRNNICLLLLSSPSPPLLFFPLRRILQSIIGSQLAALLHWFCPNSEAIRM